MFTKNVDGAEYVLQAAPKGAKLKSGVVILASRNENGVWVANPYKISELPFKIPKEILREFGYQTTMQQFAEGVKNTMKIVTPNDDEFDYADILAQAGITGEEFQNLAKDGKHIIVVKR